MRIRFERSVVFCRMSLALILVLLGGLLAEAQCTAPQTFKLLPNDGADGELFGGSVSINGTTVIVGAQYDENVNGIQAGSVYVFDTTTGQEIDKLLADDGAADDRFGKSVALDGTTAIVSARWYDDNGDYTGSAYLFDTTTWQQTFKLLPNNPSAQGFGLSVAIDGTVAIVGGNRSAYLFDTTTGQQIARLFPNGPTPGGFGFSVAISGSTAIVGAGSDHTMGDYSGSAYLFDTTTGQQIAQLFANDPAPHLHFGTSVAISGTTAIIGADGDDDNGDHSGSAYLFDTTTGQQIAKLLPDDGAADDGFGRSVGISGSTAIVGAGGDNVNGFRSGSAYVFDTTTGQQIAKILPDDGTVQDFFGGGEIGIAGTTAIVGVSRDDDNGDDSGSAYLFDISILTCPVHFEYTNGRPILVNSNGGTTMRVIAVNGGGEPQPGTGVLHVDRGNGFEAFPMNEVSNNVYDAVFPSSNCGSILNYYVNAESISGEQFSDPPNAPAATYSVISSLDTGNIVFADNFEADLGWTVTGDATDGHWERGVPVGDGARGDPLTDADGSGSCYLTDNVAGNSDVDDGSTILTSPIFDATGSGAVDAVIAYYRWYMNTRSEDIFVVEMSNNGGSSWTELETVENGVSGWFLQTFRISDFLQPTDQMRVRFIASDNDPFFASLVEAGVDGVEVRLINCGGSNVVTPDSYTVTRGDYVSGGPVELAVSDNMDLTLRRRNSDLQSRTEFEIKGSSPTATPISFEFTLEGTVFARGNVVQAIELYDYVASDWELVDTTNAARAPMPDKIVTATPTGDLSRFVEAGTMSIEARIHFQSDSPRQRFASNTDQAVWTIGQ